MPDLRQTRKDIKISLAIMVAVDVIAVVVLFSPLVGSTESRSQVLSQLSNELRIKTHDVEPLKSLDKKVVTANQQILDFYKKRFPAQDSQIIDEFGKLATANGVKIDQAKYPVKIKDEAIEQLYPVEMEASLEGSYVSLAKFINALERDDMFFIISSIELGGQQQGPVKLQMKLVTYLKAAA
jgi:type IV pilus assembly protein PilO